jgi:hypothetical protein
MKTVEVRKQIERTGKNFPVEQVEMLDLQTRIIIIASTDREISRWTR